MRKIEILYHPEKPATLVTVTKDRVTIKSPKLSAFWYRLAEDIDHIFPLDNPSLRGRVRTEDRITLISKNKRVKVKFWYDSEVMKYEYTAK